MGNLASNGRHATHGVNPNLRIGGSTNNGRNNPLNAPVFSFSEQEKLTQIAKTISNNRSASVQHKNRSLVALTKVHRDLGKLLRNYVT